MRVSKLSGGRKRIYCDGCTKPIVDVSADGSVKVLVAFDVRRGPKGGCYHICRDCTKDLQIFSHYCR